MQADLFGSGPASDPATGGLERRSLGPGAWLLRGFAQPWDEALQAGLALVLATAPWREVQTPSGPMSVRQSHCGALGWTADRQGYRYAAGDPLTGQPWPAMPLGWQALAGEAARAAGYAAFVPDTCLINRYAPGNRMGLHQDRDERDLAQPIVSVSMGLPAWFLWGGLARVGRTERVPLLHGDVLVWGGASRLRYHGVAPLLDGSPHPRWGRVRINLTFRRAGG